MNAEKLKRKAQARAEKRAKKIAWVNAKHDTLDSIAKGSIQVALGAMMVDREAGQIELRKWRDKLHESQRQRKEELRKIGAVK